MSILSSHAPGPWKAGYEGNELVVWETSTGKNYIISTVVAGGYPFCTNEEVAQAEANAHLIAAVPNLLAACQAQEALEQHQRDCEDCDGIGDLCREGFDLELVAIDQRRVALAQVEGTDSA